MEAAREAVVGGVVGALLILLVIVKLTIFKRGSNLPPARTGWIPWIGVAVPFGKEPLYYIEKTRREVSGMDAYVISLVTQPQGWLCRS